MKDRFEPDLTDDQYIKTYFRQLKDLCHLWDVPEVVARRQMDDGLLPRATYTLNGGTEYFPDDLFVFPLHIAPKLRKICFVERYELACESCGLEPRLEDSCQAWDDYLSGGYGMCLRIVLPETICMKGHLISLIKAAMESPHPSEDAWRNDLSRSIDALDALLRPFANIDRKLAGGQVSRDIYVTQARATVLLYPEAL